MQIGCRPTVLKTSGLKHPYPYMSSRSTAPWSIRPSGSKCANFIWLTKSKNNENYWQIWNLLESSSLHPNSSKLDPPSLRNRHPAKTVVVFDLIAQPHLKHCQSISPKADSCWSSTFTCYLMRICRVVWNPSILYYPRLGKETMEELTTMSLHHGNGKRYKVLNSNYKAISV